MESRRCRCMNRTRKENFSRKFGVKRALLDRRLDFGIRATPTETFGIYLVCRFLAILLPLGQICATEPLKNYVGHGQGPGKPFGKIVPQQISDNQCRQRRRIQVHHRRIAEHACNGTLLIYSGGFNPYGQKGANQQESLL